MKAAALGLQDVLMVIREAVMVHLPIGKGAGGACGEAVDVGAEGLLLRGIS